MRSILGSLTFCTLIGFSTTLLAAQNGEQWEYKSQMKSPEMEAMGMKMPAMTSKVCKEAGWEAPPKSDDDKESCKVTSFKHSDNNMAWDMQCKEGKAHGEMTLQGSDKFTGFTDFKSKDGSMRMDMSGHKLGSCDAGTTRNVVNGKEMPNATEMEAIKKQADEGNKKGQQMMAQQNANMKKMCDDALTNMNPAMFQGSCPDQTAEFCKRVETDDGLLKLSSGNMGFEAGLDAASTDCNTHFDNSKSVARVCKQAQTKENWSVLIANCPSDTKKMVKQHCHKEVMGESEEMAANEPRYKKLCEHANADGVDDATDTKSIMKNEGLKAAKSFLKF